MPRRDDIEKILLIGSGPIVIGQAAEFDYSGTQACKVLREEGYEIVLVNSNPATIMGGVQSGLHAAQMLEAGATVVAVGTESFRDPAAGTRISRELDDLFAKSGDSLD